uniref:Uncharacterized protein n=1 Tax=Meloidogyne enterolobii TaxID=390850 RepID=A0A6V7U9J3_MELEN|nr:unnamed protein product [Meloidogyne enterolobii]
MFRVTRLGLAKTGGQGRRLVSFFSNDKNAGFGLKVFEKQNSTQFIGSNFPSRHFSSYRYFSAATEDEKGKKFSSFAQKAMDKIKKIKKEVSDNFIFYLVIAYGIWLNIFMPLKRKYG